MNADLTIGAHEIHLWHAFVPNAIAPELAAAHLKLLTAQEREQQQRFHFEKDRLRYLITRVMVRTVLSRYAPIAPRDWAFVPGPYGRPDFTNDHPLANGLHFNVSHTDGLVVLAITQGRALGVDTESTAREAPLRVADRYFSASESAALRALPPAEQPHRFWELWTFKESYIKAREMGLSIPLHKFSFGFDSAGGVGIAFAQGFDDVPSRWRFWQLRPDADHLVAVCLERSATDGVQFVSRQFTVDACELPMESVLTRRPTAAH